MPPAHFFRSSLMTDQAAPPRIVFLDRATLSPRTRLRALPFNHRMETHERTLPEEVTHRVRDTDIVITNKAPITADTLDQAPQLRMIAVAATGTDNIDLRACAARGIVVSNIRDYALNTVPEHTFALIFALRRSLVAYREAVRVGRWLEAQQFCFFDFPIRNLAGSTLGIVGAGALGQATAAIGRALGLRVLFAAHGDHAGMDDDRVPLDALLAQSDILSLHCPLTPATRHLIDVAAFAHMARRPLLINTARGGLVDEAALVDALRSGQISGAGFDVVSQEPLPAQHPFQAILGHPGFILTPHVAWASDEAMQALADQLIANIAAFHAGKPRNIVGRD